MQCACSKSLHVKTKPKVKGAVKTKTHEVLQQLPESSRLRLLLNISLSEILNISKDIDTDIHVELRNAIVKLNDKLNK